MAVADVNKNHRLRTVPASTMFSGSETILSSSVMSTAMIFSSPQFLEALIKSIPKPWT